MIAKPNYSSFLRFITNAVEDSNEYKSSLIINQQNVKRKLVDVEVKFRECKSGEITQNLKCISC